MGTFQERRTALNPERKEELTCLRMRQTADTVPNPLNLTSADITQEGYSKSSFIWAKLHFSTLWRLRLNYVQSWEPAS